MRFAIFSSFLSRSGVRTSIQGLRAMSALIMVTGAMGQGCRGTVVEPPAPPPADDCECGFHLETVCTPCEMGSVCEDQCVPDEACPPGTYEQTVCEDDSTSSSSSGAGGYEPPSMPPFPGACRTECVPMPEPVCPPGTYEQTVCGGGTTTSGTGGYGEGGGGGAAGGYGTGGAGAGGYGEGGYDDGGTGGYLPLPYPEEPPCWIECVPVPTPDPACPPGTVEQTVCTDDDGGGGGGDGEPICWTECVYMPGDRAGH